MCVLLLSCDRRAGVDVAARSTRETVAFVRDDDSLDPLETLYCAGIWIGATTLITAKHCVANSDPALYARYVELEHVELVGLEMMFMVKDDRIPKRALSVMVDEANDIALVESTSYVHAGFAELAASGTIVLGDQTVIMSHPGGYAWSVGRGTIAALNRKHHDPIHEDGVNVIQLDAVLAPGASGGGAFDAEGHLIGIITFINPDVANASFLVGADKIDALRSSLRIR